MFAKFSIPDHMPVLSPGNHHPSGLTGACIMEFVSVLAGEPWSDHPETVHAGLGDVARTLNDNLGDRVFLQGLAPLAPRFIGTAKYDDRSQEAWVTNEFVFHTQAGKLDVRLTAWTVNHVIGLLPETMRINVQGLIMHLVEHGINDASGDTLTRAIDAIRPSVYPSMSAINRAAFQVVSSYVDAVQNNSRAAMYNIASHAFFVIGESEGKGAVVTMLERWLDHFDALTGHVLSDTTPDAEPVDNDGNEEEAAPAGLTMKPVTFSVTPWTQFVDDLTKNMQSIA